MLYYLHGSTYLQTIKKMKNKHMSLTRDKIKSHDILPIPSIVPWFITVQPYGRNLLVGESRHAGS